MENPVANTDFTSIMPSTIEIKHNNSYQEFINQINDNGRSFLSINSNPYTIGNYEIDVEFPLAIYSTDFASAYAIKSNSKINFLKDTSINVDNNSLNSDAKNNLTNAYDEDHYALVFKNDLPIRLFEIVYLSNNKIDNLISPLAYGLTKIPLYENELCFVVVMPKAKGRNVKSLINKGMIFNENLIFKKFLNPLYKLLSQLHDNSIVHGNINTSNIYLDENGNLELSDCISVACGHNQHAFNETIEKAQCMKFGKGLGTIDDDYYALGLTIFTLATGIDYHNLSNNKIIKDKLRNGTFTLLSNDISHLNKLSILIKGLCADDPAQRWKLADINIFLITNGIIDSAGDERTYINKPIVFNDQEINNSRELAHELSQNWDLAIDFIKSVKIKKWLSSCRSEEKKYELLDTFNFYISARSTFTQEVFGSDDEKLIRTLILIDPDGPVRLRNISFNKSGLGLLILNAFNFGQINLAQTVINTIVTNIYNTYEHVSTHTGNNYYAKHLQKIPKCIEYLQKNDLIGFGVERCIYELNPTLPCQSKLLKRDFCINTKDVLSVLNDQSATLEQMCEKHIITFLAAKISGHDSFLISRLREFPQFEKSKAFQISSILSIAQKQSKIGTLFNITNTLKDALIEFINLNIKSNIIRTEYINNIDGAAESGMIEDLINAASNAELLRKDATNYLIAIKKCAVINKEILGYKNVKVLNNFIRIKSLKLATQFSYALCGIILLTIILKSL